MNHKGAPTKRTKDLIVRLCAHVSKGTPLTVACKAVGVHRSTVYDWMEKAEERGGLYAELKGRLEAAEAQSNIDLIAVVRACAIDNKDWKAAQFLLMARLPEYFNYHRDRAVYHKHEHVGADGGPIRISAEAKIDALVAAMQPHELEALVRQALMAPPEAAIKEIAAPRDHDLLDAELVED